MPSTWLKNVVIAGGEKLASIEVDPVRYRRPDISTTADVARPHVKWCESLCAFVALRAVARVTDAGVIAFCRYNTALFMASKTVAICTMPKTATANIQKFIPRAIARKIGSRP